MRQYVLDVPDVLVPPAAPVAPADGSPAPSERAPGWGRTFLWVLLLEPLALAVLYVAMSGGSATSTAAPAAAIGHVPWVAVPRPSVAAPATAPVAAATDLPPRPSRITRDGAGVRIDLHAVEPGVTLAMLARATQSSVSGGDIFVGSPLRLTRSTRAASPQEAWRAVFGDVANFAIACAGSTGGAGGACEVRFVSLTHAGASLPSVAPGRAGAPPTQIVASGVQPAQAPVAPPALPPALPHGAGVAVAPPPSEDPAAPDN